MRLLIDARKGEDIDDVAEQLVSARQLFGELFDGFVFNDVVIRWRSGDEADSLVARYPSFLSRREVV